MSQTMEETDVISEENPKHTQKSRRPASMAPGRIKIVDGHADHVIRYCVPTTTIKSMATHPHPQNRPTSLLRHRNHLRAHWRRATLRQLESPRDYHRLLTMQLHRAAMSDLPYNTCGEDHAVLQELNGHGRGAMVQDAYGRAIWKQ